MPFPLSTPSDFSTLPWNETPPRRPFHHGLSATRPLEDPALFDSTDNSSVPFINHLSTPPRLALHSQSRKKRPSSPHTPRAIKRTRRTAPSPSPSTSSARYLSPRSPKLSSSSFSPLLFAEVELTARPTLHKPATDMSFLSNLQPNFLSAKVEVVFDAEGRVEMVTGPNTGTTYSLPGHVVIGIAALPTSLDGKIRAIKELVVKVEGKSEFFDEAGRYTPMRLFADSIQLASEEHPLLIPAQDPARRRASHVRLAVPFDLRLPGWLPPTFLSVMTDTSYGCVAEVQISWLEDSVSVRPKAILSNPSLYPSAFTRAISKYSEFTVRRHRVPMTVNGRVPERGERHFTLGNGGSSSASPLECILTVPEWIDVNGEEKSLKVSLRVRARRPVASALGHEVEQSEPTEEDLPATESAASTEEMDAPSPQMSDVSEAGSVPMERQASSYGVEPSDEVFVFLKELGMEVEEVEQFSSRALPIFAANCPIPAQQPSRSSNEHSLISPRPPYATSSFLGDPNDATPYRGTRTRHCLLAEDGNQRNFTFDDEGLGLGDKWRKVNVVLPMPRLGKRGDLRNGGRPQADMDSPFLRIKQNLKMRLVCLKPGTEEETVVVLSTPIRFGTTLDTVPDAKRKTYLPAYVQLFHDNGELRDCDPLPVYSRYEDMEVDEDSEENPDAPDYKSLFPASPARSASPSSSFRSPSPSTISDTDQTDSESSYSRETASSWSPPAVITGSKMPAQLAIPAFV